MIKFSGTNVLVHSISQVITISSKTGGQDFQKRELIIDDSWDKDGKHYTNFVSIEFTGDKMQLLDSFYPGMRVNVEGMVSGREYNGRIFNTVRGLSISVVQQSAPAPMPGGYPQQVAPGGYPQPSYPQQQYVQSAAQFGPAPMPGGYQQPSAPVNSQQEYQATQFPPPADINARTYSPTTVPGASDLPFHH